MACPAGEGQGHGGRRWGLARPDRQVFAQRRGEGRAFSFSGSAGGCDLSAVLCLEYPRLFHSGHHRPDYRHRCGCPGLRGDRCFCHLRHQSKAKRYKLRLQSSIVASCGMCWGRCCWIQRDCLHCRPRHPCTRPASIPRTPCSTTQLKLRSATVCADGADTRTRDPAVIGVVNPVSVPCVYPAARAREQVVCWLCGGGGGGSGGRWRWQVVTVSTTVVCG